MDEGGGEVEYLISDDELTPNSLLEQNLGSETMETGENNDESTNSKPPSPPDKVVNNYSSTTPRPKAYPLGSKGPFLVFFRPKGKPLNKLQIEKDLAKSFRTVEDVSALGRDKLRITVGDRNEANKIAAFELFSLEYRVYIPSREVEIAGVVTEQFLTCADIKAGTGGFKNRAVPSAQVLDVRQMNRVSSDGTKTTSDSFRVTFSGAALPDYLLIRKLRLPVRLYVPSVMHCDKCQQIGHTAPYCCNKPRCGKCGEKHVEGPCSNEPKCACCGEAPHDLATCPKYVEREKHQLRSLQQRSKRSYAEMLKKIALPAVPPLPKFSTENPFAALSAADHGSNPEAGEACSVLQTGSKRKRMAAERQRQRQQSSQSITSEQQVCPPALNTSKSSGKKKKVNPPGFKPIPGDFPPLPGSSKTPDAPIFQFKGQQASQQEGRQKQADASGKMTLSDIMSFIFDLLDLSPATRNLINMALSFMKPLLQQLASKWPVLESIISFDG